MTIEWAMSDLVKNPETMEKAQQEIREAMRGKNKLEGTRERHIQVQLPQIGHQGDAEAPSSGPSVAPENESYWGADAESFKPERFENGSVDFRGFNLEFLPFGVGRRICPGMTFGLSAVEVGLAHLLFHFDWKLPHDMKTGDLDMMEISGTSTPSKTPLAVLADLVTPLP
ncbi:hypothetical protein ZIOFF_008867 [Zingiber officinale]|uniref:Uncharacterized protein n=1 Tax=Zingiber officinale TaxID=94328 RepID=A0A8J5HWR9_ZINOF|nr:hypothetical protein ZIOFF_008867 [Zingiber officinale]